MLRSWLGGKSLGHGSTQSLTALEEPSQIIDAMAAATHIMNDDLKSAEEELSKGNSAFHKLGKGVVIFMQATLGFEQEVMREASDRLADAEHTAYENHRKAQRSGGSYKSPIYPPGTEYALCLAMAQLMAAVVGVLNESLTEALKAFYKLRKAFITLEGILEAEKKFVAERSTISLNSTESSSTTLRDSAVLPSEKAESISNKRLSSEQGDVAVYGENKNKTKAGKEEFEFYDADETHEGAITPAVYEGHLGSSSNPETPTLPTVPSTPVTGSNAPSAEQSEDSIAKALADAGLRDEENIDMFGDNPVDMFVIAGSNMCFGILLLMISMIPPAFASLLKIIGFKGDRERGIQLLWQSSKFHNIYGGMSGLILFTFYNILLGLSDIVPRTGNGAIPKERLKALLADMRERYPKSHLWLLEEARMLAAEKQIEKALELMGGATKSPLKQVEALQQFETSMNLMFIHNYVACSASFQKCVTLNNWSHGLYYYIAGCCHVELYRKQKTTSPKEALSHAKKAEELLRIVPQNTGKKRFMARQLPFDVFVNRKLQKWDHRAHEWKVNFIDAIGVSPIEEMIYFWSGHRRMSREHLEESLSRLAWSTSKENPLWEKEGLDEHAILALLNAATLRNLKKTDEAKEVLVTEILAHDRAKFKGQLKDEWTAPCARYEMATNFWVEYADGGEQREKLNQCWKYLDEVSKWESYELDTRIGLKITTAKGTLRKLGVGVDT